MAGARPPAPDAVAPRVRREDRRLDHSAENSAEFGMTDRAPAARRPGQFIGEAV
jgi:hypothetical protein